jgi:signal transduction histidine kinase
VAADLRRVGRAAPLPIDLRAFVGETVGLLGPVIPDETIFTCQFADTPEVQADPDELRRMITDLVAYVCGELERGIGEVHLRTGVVPGRSGPHAFVEVSRPGTGSRIPVPLLVFRKTHLAGVGAGAGS